MTSDYQMAGAYACLFSTLVLTSATALAATERDLGAHEHGAARLQVFVEPGLVAIEFESPWANLVGFEHEPGSEADRQAVDQALNALRQPESLFMLDPPGCTGAVTELLAGMQHDEHAAEQDEHDEHDEHAAKQDEHDEHAAEQDEHDEHDEEHAHEHDDEASHAEVLVSYQFDCQDGTTPSTLQVMLLQRWPGIEALQVEMVGPGGQSAQTLEAGSDSVTLESVL